MTTRVDYEALIKQFYAARIGNRLTELQRLFAADAVFQISGVSHAKPIAIKSSGAQEIASWLNLLLKTFRVTDFVILTLIIDGPKAAVHWRAHIHSRITGARVLTELVDLIEVREGQIISYNEFFTRAAGAQ